MNRVDFIWRKVKLIAMAAAMWTAVHGQVLAAPGQRPGDDSTQGGGQSWVFPYFVVLMGVGLGMLVVCRSSRRAERARPEEYKSLTNH